MGQRDFKTLSGDGEPAGLGIGGEECEGLGIHKENSGRRYKLGRDDVTVPSALPVTSCIPHPTNPHLGLVLYSWGSSAFFSCTQHYYS